MNIENQKFEEWRKEQIASLVRMGYPEAAKAFRDLGSIHWMAWQSSWQASRAAIEVELPSAIDAPEFVGFPFSETIEAIESLGLKVKL